MVINTRKEVYSAIQELTNLFRGIAYYGVGTLVLNKTSQQLLAIKLVKLTSSMVRLFTQAVLLKHVIPARLLPIRATNGRSPI